MARFVRGGSDATILKEITVEDIQKEIDDYRTGR
jgi:hypothetical protein